MTIIAKINKRNRYKKTSLLLAIVLLLFGLTTWIGINSMFRALDENNQEEYIVTIKPGASTASIAQTLAQENIIDNPNAFRIFSKIKGLDGKLKAGEYLLSPSMDLEEITKKLLKGQVVSYSFTIPEGYTLRQIAQVLIDKGYVDEEKFWEVVKNEPFPEFEFLEGLPNDEKRLEGYLFPDTYRITSGMTEQQIVAMMLKRFQEVYNQLPENQSGLNFRDTIILASIVELESKVDRDRPLIASVFLNRLGINMLLQADATLQYAFPERKSRVLYSDLELDSPYNSYKYTGLPPGPIGSPGRAALEAVHQPADTDYLYFVARKDGSGEHVFGRTLAEHNKNRRELGY